jgi:hypothetical protein
MARRTRTGTARRAGRVLAWSAVVLVGVLPASAATAEPQRSDGTVEVGASAPSLHGVVAVGQVSSALHRWDDGTTHDGGPRSRPPLTGAVASGCVGAAEAATAVVAAAPRAIAVGVAAVARGRAPPRVFVLG